MLRIMPDVELLVINWLRTISELDGVAIHSAFGPEQTWPAVRVVRIGGTRLWPAYVDHARLQIEGWGRSKAEALNVTETTLATLVLDLPGSHDEGVVSAVDVGLSPVWSPDSETGQPRYTADVTITVHPSPDQGGS